MAKLYFRYGAMGCGKTMQLLQVAFNYEERGHKVCVIKPKTDTKNGTKILTRIGPERDTNFCFDKETDLYNKISKDYNDVQCVLVDEAQFLTAAQADQLMCIVNNLNIPVIAYGLRLNFRLTDGGFEGATRLLQIAHEIEELKTICECGKKATCNARFLNGEFVADGPDVLIDGTTEIEYRAICPKCYDKYLTSTGGRAWGTPAEHKRRGGRCEDRTRREEETK
ncbi:thymidine kinase [Candidatus Saccharibacteria bacterium]|nr:thymidine kinase [Candidatus Saccharibacteria bacterium]